MSYGAYIRNLAYRSVEQSSATQLHPCVQCGTDTAFVQRQRAAKEVLETEEVDPFGTCYDPENCMHSTGNRTAKCKGETGVA